MQTRGKPNLPPLSPFLEVRFLRGGRTVALFTAQPNVHPLRIKTAIVRRNLIASPSSAQATPMVNRLTVVPEKTLQLKSFAIEESPLDPDVITSPKRPKTIDIRPASIVGERNDDPLSGLIAYFEGAALEVYLLHPPIDRLYPGSGPGHTAPTLIPIPDAFLDADQIRIGVAPRVLLQLHGHDVPGLQCGDP